MQPAPSNDSYKYFKRVRSRLINAERCSHAAACHAEARRRWVSPCCHGQQSQNASTERGGYSSCYLAMIAMALCSVIRTQAQEPTLPSRTGQPGITIEEVIVTGSNIPTSEEVGPQPVDTYRRADIERLGVRSATDFVQKLPVVAGTSINENVTSNGDGRVEVNLRGILPKETLVLQDGRRLAPVGFAGDTVDLNMFPFGLIDHIDILKDGASAIYGSDAVDGVFNVVLIHRFRGLEVYASYGNTNLGFANDRGEETAYLLAGTGDDKTNIVVYAGIYNSAALYSRDVNISHDPDKSAYGSFDLRSSNMPGRVTSRYFKGLAKPPFKLFLKTPTPHSTANQITSTQYTRADSAGFGPGGITSERQAFNFADLTPDIAASDREYLYGSFDRDICDKYLTVFADFKYFRQFWDGGLAPTPFTPDVWADAQHPFGISASGISVPA